MKTILLWITEWLGDHSVYWHYDYPRTAYLCLKLQMRIDRHYGTGIYRAYDNWIDQLEAE